MDVSINRLFENINKVKYLGSLLRKTVDIYFFTPQDIFSPNDKVKGPKKASTRKIHFNSNENKDHKTINDINILSSTAIRTAEVRPA